MTQRASKPTALLDLTDILPSTYEVLKKELQVPDRFTFRLEGIDAVNGEQLRDPVEQLELAHCEGVVTTNDIVVGLCREIVRALRQLAPGCSPAANETLQLAYQHLVGCVTVVSTQFGGELGELQ